MNRHSIIFAAIILSGAGAVAIAQAPSPSAGAWQHLHQSFYGDREIGEVDENYMRVEAPANTPDPAATPLTIHFGPDAAGKIKQVRVIIDNNPSPLATTMNLAPDVPIDQIDLRVRIDRFTTVRAIAETTDGRLEMRSTWVNAAGGCSAPPAPGGAGQLGDVRFRSTDDRKALQFGIHHPNSSGFQIDPVSGDAIPPHYITHIRLTSGGKTLLEADTGISLSENPTIRIASAKPLPEPIQLEASDIPRTAHYSATWDGGNAEAMKTVSSGSGR